MKLNFIPLIYIQYLHSGSNKIISIPSKADGGRGMFYLIAVGWYWIDTFSLWGFLHETHAHFVHHTLCDATTGY